MERVWTGDPRRLSRVDRLRIERLHRAGETFASTAAMVGCSTKSIQRYLALTGGLQSRIRERSPRLMSLKEREEISRGLTAGDSRRAIAARLNRSPSTISREVPGTVGVTTIGPGVLTLRPWREVAGPSRPSCHTTPDYGVKWSGACEPGGRLSRSRPGLCVSILTI
jgi:hypothetical protein